MIALGWVDWTATGSWMQAWGSFAQAGAVVFAAHKASNVFEAWRRQKIAERKITLAEQILDVAYRVRRAFAYVRHGMMEGGALTHAEATLREQDAAWLEGLGDQIRKSTIYSQAVYDRIDAHSDDWNDLNAAMASGRTFFGAAVEEQLQKLWRQRSSVIALAQAYATDRGNDAAFSAQIRRGLWEGYGRFHGAKNEVDDAIAEAFDTLERLLQPILRDSVREGSTAGK